MTGAANGLGLRARAFRQLLLVGAAILAGCALDPRVGLAGDSIEKRIDWQGGTVGLCRVRDEVGRCIHPGASMSVPWGALDVGADRVFGIRALVGSEEASVLARVPEGLEPASDIFEFTPGDAEFNRLLIPTITIPFTVGGRDMGMVLLRVEDSQGPLCVFRVGGGIQGLAAQGLATTDRLDAIFTATRFGTYMVAHQKIEGATEAARDAATADMRCTEQ